MKIRRITAAIGAGGVLALAAAIPAAQAKEVDASSHSTSSLSAQTLARLEAQGLAQAAAVKEMKTLARTARILDTAGWSAEAKYYFAYGGR
jgi:hypothetical protein